MRSQKDSFEESLRSIDPLDSEEMERVSAGAEKTLAAILASEREELGRPNRLRPAHALPRLVLPPARRKRLAAAIPLFAAGLLAVVLGLPGGGSRDAPSTLPALARVAEAAAAQAPPDPRLPFLYSKTREVVTNGTVAHGQAWQAYGPVTREEWVAEDGSGRMRTVSGPARFVGPGDREAWEAAGRIRFVRWGIHSEEHDVPPGYFRRSLHDGVKLAELPTDPGELAEWLEHRVTDPKADAGAGNGFSVAVRVLTLVGDLLNNPLAAPELRAALYEAAGQIEGIEFLGQATDRLGRSGIAVGAESSAAGAPTRYLLIFDPETSEVLARERIVLEVAAGFPDPGGPVTETMLFLASTRVPALGSRP